MQGKRNKEKSVPLILVILIILLIIGIVFFLKNRENNDNMSNVETIAHIENNSLIGTFIYETDGTKYTFKKDETGSMSSDSFNFDYKYKIDENILNIDFENEKVHDATYTFEVNNETLKLISKEGTASIGEEYILKRVNK